MVSNQELFLAFYSYKWVSDNEASPFSSRYFKNFPQIYYSATIMRWQNDR